MQQAMLEAEAWVAGALNGVQRSAKTDSGAIHLITASIALAKFLSFE